MKKRGTAITDYLPWILISVAVLAIFSVVIFFQLGTGESLIAKIKGIFTGGIG